MIAMTMLRPAAISGYDDNGTRRLMAVSDRELTRTETFLRRVLRAEHPLRGRYALITSTMRDMPHMAPFERVLISKGVICCGAEANPWDGARVESIIRRFDVALVAVITPIVLQAVRSAGHDPLKLLAGKTVWASGAAYDELRGVPGIDLRRWAAIGPALAIEGRHGGGAHVDGREWQLELEGARTYVSSRLDRAHTFDRLRIDTPIRIMTEPCPSGAYGPRIALCESVDEGCARKNWGGFAIPPRPPVILFCGFFDMTRHPELAPYLDVHRYGLGDLLHEQARVRRDMVAVVDGAHRFTFRELDERVNRLASVLRERGVAKGERVLWLGQNSFRVLEVLLASARLGAIVCPANWRASALEIDRTLRDLDPKVVFWQESEIGEANRKTRGEWQAGRHWIQHDGSDPDGYESLVAAGHAADQFEPVEVSTPLLAIYTAAFSGEPNAALLSHESLLLTAMLSQQGQQIDERSGYLVSGPMFHLGVLMGTLATFLAGGRCAFVARVDAEQLLDMIEADRLTHAYIPQPTILQMRDALQSKPRDVSSLFATPDMADWRMPMVMPAQAPLVQRMGGYGQTEIGGLTVMMWLGGSGAGRTAPFLQIKIADDAGHEVPDGELGEILARGPLVMCGYWRRPEENARRVVNGWHRTNDLGRRLPDGSIAFTGPKTAMIKSALENIYPAEIEACLRQHEGVADVCVIGVPDPVWTQNVKAIVVRKPGADFAAQSLIDFCRERLASYKKPKILVFADSLPRTAVGFVDRAAVDAAHGGGNYPGVL